MNNIYRNVKNYLTLTKALKKFSQREYGVLILTSMEPSVKATLVQNAISSMSKRKKKGVFVSNSFSHNDPENTIDKLRERLSKSDYAFLDFNMAPLGYLEPKHENLLKMIQEFSQKKLVIITAQPQHFHNDPPFYHNLLAKYHVSEIKLISNDEANQKNLEMQPNQLFIYHNYIKQ